MAYQKLMLALLCFSPALALPMCNIEGTMEQIGDGEVPICKYFDGHGPGAPECVLPGRVIKQKDGLPHVVCPTSDIRGPLAEDEDERESRACASFCEATPAQDLEKKEPALDGGTTFKFSP